MSDFRFGLGSIAQTLLVFLYRREIGERARCSAMHAPDLDRASVDSIRAAHAELRRAGFVTDDTASYEPTENGRSIGRALAAAEDSGSRIDVDPSEAREPFSGA